jgi:hypothetical protein
MQQDERGYAITTQSAEAASALDTAIHNFLHWKADIIPNLKKALAAEPDFGFGHAVNGLILHGARHIGLRSKIEASLAAAQAAAGDLTERERLYVAALDAAAGGRIAESVSIYETILAHHPSRAALARTGIARCRVMGSICPAGPSISRRRIDSRKPSGSGAKRSRSIQPMFGAPTPSPTS